jgi:hypothetical protein
VSCLPVGSGIEQERDHCGVSLEHCRVERGCVPFGGARLDRPPFGKHHPDRRDGAEAGEFRQQANLVRREARDNVGRVLANLPGSGGVATRAGSDEAGDDAGGAFGCGGGDAEAAEIVEGICPAELLRPIGDARAVVCHRARIGPGVDERAKVGERAAAVECVAKQVLVRGCRPPGRCRGIRAAREQQVEHREVIEVERAGDGIRSRDPGTSVEERAGAVGRARLSRMIERLAVVGLGASGEQKRGHIGIMSDARGGIEDGQRVLRPVRVNPAGIRIGAGGEEAAGGFDQPVLSAGVDEPGAHGDGERRQLVIAAPGNELRLAREDTRDRIGITGDPGIGGNET